MLPLWPQLFPAGARLGRQNTRPQAELWRQNLGKMAFYPTFPSEPQSTLLVSLYSFSDRDSFKRKPSLCRDSEPPHLGRCGRTHPVISTPRVSATGHVYLFFCPKLHYILIYASLSLISSSKTGCQSGCQPSGFRIPCCKNIEVQVMSLAT